MEREREGRKIGNKKPFFFTHHHHHHPPSHRVTTKWSTSPGRIGRKECWRIMDGLDLRPRWSLDVFTPEVGGSLGAAPPARARRSDHDDASASTASSTSTSRRRSRAAVDLGHCHVRVPRVDAVVDADGAARTLATLAAALAVAPARAVLGVPLAAARGLSRAVRGGGGSTREPRAIPPPLATQRGGLVRELVDQPPPPPPPPPGAPPPGEGPGFRVRGWPWPLAVADALEAGAARLRAGGGRVDAGSTVRRVREEREREV